MRKDIQIIPVELPLSLMRTMQSTKLKEQVIPSREREKDLIINKKNQTALDSVSAFFRPNNDGSTKEINTRLNEKLNRIAHYNLAYLMSTPLEDIAQAMQKHTFSGFEARILEENKARQENTTQNEYQP